jgi:hypothetical protein
MEGEPSTSKYKESSVSDYGNPGDAKQEITDAVHYCLQLLQEGKYVMAHMSNGISSHKWGGGVKMKKSSPT